MKRNYFKYLLQAVVLLCTSLVVSSCDDVFASEDNPIASYLSMSDKAVTIKAGETYKRTAIAVSDAVIEYSSSDVAVATVDQSGTVTGVAAGTTTITAKATGYSTGGKKIFVEEEKKYEVTVTGGAVYRVYTSATAYTDEAIPEDAITVESSTAAVSWSAGTYVVEDDVTITGDITLTGDVNLILCDGAELTVNGKIDGDTNDKSLYIYGQDLSTGKLTIDANGGGFDIVVEELYIHGGDISATNADQAIETAGLFRTYHGNVNASGVYNGLMILNDLNMDGGSITASSTNGAAVSVYNSYLSITNGSLTATTTAPNAAGIDVTYDINIYGGTVIATGGDNPSGNGGYGIYCFDGDVTISGDANVTATGGNGSGVGSIGGHGIYVNVDKSIIIEGGTVNATAGDGTGSGGYALITDDGSTGRINITGGNVTATATGTYGVGICTKDLSIGQSGKNPTVNATGAMEGIYASTITIETGTTTATATGYTCIGIEGTIVINNGKLIAIGGDAAPGSNNDGGAGIDGTLTVHNGEVTATGGAKDGTGDDGTGISVGTTITLDAGITMYEGTSPDPTTPATSQTQCSKRYAIIK